MVVWWGETCCAPNSLDFGSCFYANWGKTLTTVPVQGTIARPLGLGTESCCLTNCFGFRVCHQLVPHLVPNFPRVPLRNVSWGLGVCAVLVRSVSPCRLVSGGPSVSPPPPPALFLAVSARRVSAFFFLLPFRVDPALAGCVRVCNI